MGLKTSTGQYKLYNRKAAVIGFVISLEAGQSLLPDSACRGWSFCCYLNLFLVVNLSPIVADGKRPTNLLRFAPSLQQTSAWALCSACSLRSIAQQLPRGDLRDIDGDAATVAR